MTTSGASTRRRVKLYTLNDERQWDDKGTGHVSANYTEQNVIALVVISENDGSCLLESKIHPETAYQKQQETLIVWSEGENSDLALSFQEKAGCDDIWEKICNVQGKDPSVEITQDVVDESDDTDEVEAFTMTSNQALQNFELPPCELSRLEEIAELTSAYPNPLQKRERLVNAIERTNYIRQMIDLFHKAEDLEDLTSLHHLYEIFRQLILFNKQILYDTLFSDDLIMDVIGILEYSPAGRTHHRDFLQNQANFREVLPLRNTELVNKIHQTYRVQYIQDCCLPPPGLFDEHIMSALKSFISCSKIAIISALQEDDECMLQLFTSLKSQQTSDTQRRELALFVKEFCNLSVQTDQKDNFLSTLSAHGALSTVEVLLTFNDRDVKSAALEVLQAFIENQPSVIREYVCKDNVEINVNKSVLINLMITRLLEDPDPELGDAYQLVYMLRILIDPDTMNNVTRQSGKTEFLNFFYKHCMSTLTKPLFENTAHDTLRNDTYHSALILSNVLELLIFCIESHTYHMKNYCLHRDLVKRVLILLRSTHKFLVLSALRLLRRVVQMKAEFYNRYLIKNNLFKPVIDLFIANGHRYNMIDSAVIELFEYLLAENITTLIGHIVREYSDVLCDIKYVNTFEKLKEQYEATLRRSRAEGPSGLEHLIHSSMQPQRVDVNSRFTCGVTEFEDDEQWFNQDDDDDEEETSPTNPHNALSSISPEAIPTLIFPSSRNFSPPSPDADSLVLVNAPSPAPTHVTSPFARLVRPSSPPDMEFPVSRHPPLSSHSSISIHIKSTCLGSTENKADDHLTLTHSSTVHAVKRPSSSINSSNADDADVSPDKNSNNSSSYTVLNTSPDIVSDTADDIREKRSRIKISDIQEATNASEVIGLVDYSDGESDEDESVVESSQPEGESKSTLAFVSEEATNVPST